MPRLVMKFGGTSVATVERIRNVARHVKREVEAGYDVAVVVSAMAGKTNELVGWVKEASAPLRFQGIRRGRRLGRAGHVRAPRPRAPGDGPAGPVLAGLADPDPDLRRAWLGPHRRRSTARGSCAGLRRAPRGRRGVRLPGPAPADRPHHHARARRLGHQRRGARGGDRGGALRHLHGRRRRLHDRPAHRPQGAPARPGLLRGDARDGLARRQGAAGALGRARHGAPACRPMCAPPSTTRPTRSSAPSSATRKTSWNSRSSPASPIPRTRPRSRCATSPTSPASPPRSSCRSPTPTSTST